MISCTNLALVIELLIAMSLIVMGYAMNDIFVIIAGGFMLNALLLNRVLAHYEEQHFCTDPSYSPV